MFACFKSNHLNDRLALLARAFMSLFLFGCSIAGFVDTRVHAYTNTLGHTRTLCRFRTITILMAETEHQTLGLH